MKTIQFSVLTLTTLILLQSPLLAAENAKGGKCKFEVDPKAMKIEWTAFKTTQKVPVNGSFTEVVLSGDVAQTTTFEKFLGQMDAEINLTDVTKIKTGNPARDTTLFNSFFSLFKKKPVIKGALREVKGTNKEGEFGLHLTMNQKTLSVPMKYTRDEKGQFMAKGVIDLNDFGLQSAFASLHKACEDLHKGPDGVSKTWTTVEIKISASIAEKCGS